MARAQLSRVFQFLLLRLLGVLKALGGGLLAWRRPSLEADWQSDHAQITEVEIQGDTVLLGGVRHWRYHENGKLAEKSRYDARLDARRIERVHFLLEPIFAGDAAAHTFLRFDFEDGQRVGLSVEARKKKGERYNPLAGALHHFELIHVWASIEDLVGARTRLRKHPVYQYPLRIPRQGARQLFLRLADDSEDLAQKPRFYNTLTSNCTNTLARHVDHIAPGLLPQFALSRIFTGYADRSLLKAGLLDVEPGLDIEALRARYRVDPATLEPPPA